MTHYEAVEDPALGVELGQGRVALFLESLDAQRVEGRVVLWPVHIQLAEVELADKHRLHRLPEEDLVYSPGDTVGEHHPINPRAGRIACGLGDVDIPEGHAHRLALQQQADLAVELDGQITKLLLDAQLGSDVFVLVIAEDLTENVRDYHYRVALIPARKLGAA